MGACGKRKTKLARKTRYGEEVRLGQLGYWLRVLFKEEKDTLARAGSEKTDGGQHAASMACSSDRI